MMMLEEEGDEPTSMPLPSMLKPTRVSLQPPAEPIRQRRVSRDIVSALGRLELVRGKANEALCELKRRQSLSRGDSVDGAGEVMPFGDQQQGEQSHVDYIRQQLEEMKRDLRETKGELAQVSYRAEVLESERRKYRQRVAALEEQVRQCRHEDLEVMSGPLSVKSKNMRSGPVQKASQKSPKRNTEPAVTGTDDHLTSSADSNVPDSSLPLLEKLREKDQVIERIQQQLDFYADELRSKVHKEQQLSDAVEAAEARYQATQHQLEELEDRFEAVEEDCASMRNHREGVLRLAERCMTEAQHLGEMSGSTQRIQQLLVSRDSTMNDLVVRCALQDEQIRTMKTTMDKLLFRHGVSGSSEDARSMAYREEISWLQQCLLRQLTKDQQKSQASGSELAAEVATPSSSGVESPHSPD